MELRVAITMLLLLALGASEAVAREWSDSSGKYTVEAELVDLKDGVVRLLREDGQILGIPTEWLSETDRQFLAAQSGTRSVVVVPTEGRKWALLIGINDYAEIKDLDYCMADVQTLKDRLISVGFPDQNVFTLSDGASPAKYLPSKVNIERELAGVLSLVGRHDLLVVGFSGHGVHLDGSSYFCPMEASLAKPEETLISLEAVYAQLSACEAGQKLLLVDACRDDPRPGGAKTVKATAGAKGFAKSLEQPPGGILVLTSCQPGQVSVEDPKLGHGVFMHFVLAGLAGAADREEGNRNGAVSLLELYKFAESHTKSHVWDTRSLHQTPMLRGEIKGDYEIARLESPSRSAPEPSAPQVVTSSIGMKMVLIPAGEFMMGSPDSDENAEDTEKPQHGVKITKPFYLGVYEVTQEEYERVTGENPSHHEGDPKRPVENVSWNDAVEFCRLLSEKEGERYRLPTEAEWEYSCRAGEERKWCFGDSEDSLGAYAWFGSNSGRETHPVGDLNPNRWGLYDMHGNVWEWCWDGHEEDFYKRSGRDDPAGPTEASYHVYRGGSAMYDSRVTRSAYRVGTNPYTSRQDLGFRVVRSPQ